MTYAVTNLPLSMSPAAAFSSTMKTLLVDGGFTFVETVVSGANSYDIYKSNAADNVQGADWYFQFSRTSDAALTVNFNAAEQWNTTTKLYTNLVGYASTAVTVGVNAYTPATTPANMPYGTTNVVTAPSKLWTSITPNRIIWTQSNMTYGFYMGLFEENIPVSMQQFPLTVANLQPTVTAANQLVRFSREPLPSGGTGYGAFPFCGTYGAVGWWGGTPSTAVNAYWQQVMPFRVPVCAANQNSPAIGLRGFLRDVVYFTPNGFRQGDVVTVSEGTGTSAADANYTCTGTAANMWMKQV